MDGTYSHFAPPPSSSSASQRQQQQGGGMTAPLDFAWVESLPDACVLLDKYGSVVAANATWRRCGQELGEGLHVGVGTSFLRACAAVPGLEKFRVDLERLLDGQQPAGRASAEFAWSVGSALRWYHLIATPTADGALVTQREVTRRKTAEEESNRLADERLAERHYYEELLAHVPAVVWEGTCRPDGAGLRLRFVSRHAQRLLGIAVGELLGVDDALLQVTHPEDRPRVSAELARLANAGGGESTLACRWLRPDGSVLWVESRLSLTRGRTGELGVRGVSTDVTATREWEESLRQRNAQLAALARSLKRSNEELDQYAYITSHDLKAPLRGIANLSNWIEEDLGPAVTPDAHRQFELLRGRVHRMESLIGGILAFSRVGRVHIAPELVPVGKLLKDIVDLLSPPPGFVVEVGADMPTLYAERTRLQQVFMNLISNAIKHHGDPARGRVTVTAREVGDCYEFAVADNGPGIDPAYHHKVWMIFQTLRPRDQVEGTGVGLSLVKKIVEDQGGTVRLDSRPGDGSTFTFTWQKDVRAVRPIDPPAPAPRRSEAAGSPSPGDAHHGS